MVLELLLDIALIPELLNPVSADTVPFRKAGRWSLACPSVLCVESGFFPVSVTSSFSATFKHYSSAATY